METFKTAIAAIIAVATVTVLVLPRSGQPVPQVIRQLGQFMSNSISAMLGTESR